MITKTLFVAMALSASISMGQDPVALPYDLADLAVGIANPAFADIPELTDSIRIRGIDFGVGDQELGKIIDAGSKGKRDPKEMAALITAVLNACQDCRARYLTPLTPEDLQTMLKRFTPQAVFREVRARGVNGLENSEGTANVLRAWGAKEDLVAFLIPDDKIPTIPLLPPYKVAPLKAAQEYDLAAKEGWLKINTELPAGSQSEFIFKHNALFVKAVTGDEPKEIQAYFSKPAPRNKTAELVDVECGLETPATACGPETRDEKRNVLIRTVSLKNSKSKIPIIEYSFVAPDGDGRAGFRIAVANTEKTPQKYSAYLRWRVLDAPKPPPPTLGGKK